MAYIIYITAYYYKNNCFILLHKSAIKLYIYRYYYLNIGNSISAIFKVNIEDFIVFKLCGLIMYQEYIMEHYRYPKNRGILENPDLQACIRNNSCGDHVIIQGTVEYDHLVKVRFEGAGCVISQAAASILLDYAQGRTLNALMGLDSEAMQALLGLALGPLRLRCSLIALEVLHVAINQYRMGRNKEE